ncbi:Secondary metabolism regulator LAE1 [Fusarium oxysporum f. sp. albedinis]|nr:Secondary metabolism regulator LAE1 [Fusarium oxysporum f. sp. albedinis]
MGFSALTSYTSGCATYDGDIIQAGAFSPDLGTRRGDWFEYIHKIKISDLAWICQAQVLESRISRLGTADYLYPSIRSREALA